MKRNSYIYEVNEFTTDPETLMLHETLFHSANGYLGVRGNFEERYPEHIPTIRGKYVNGYYDISNIQYGEKLYGFPETKQTMVNITDTQTMLLRIEGEVFSLFSGKILSYAQQLDMEKGIYIRTIQWQSPSGKEIELEIRRMASFTVLELFLIEYKIKPINFDGVVEIISEHDGDIRNFSDDSDPRVSAHSEKNMEVQEISFDKEASIIVSKAVNSKLQLASVVRHTSQQAYEKNCEVLEDKLSERFSFDAKKGEEIILFKYSVTCDERRYQDCKQAAINIMNAIIKIEPSTLYQEQQEYLTRFWRKSEVNIDGDEALNRSLHFSLYQLLQSVGKDRFSNIAAKGLSGEGYEGHYFWDTEIYMLPFFILTQREIAKNLISYRYSILDAARENARLVGHKKGVLFPWRTIAGSECSAFFPAGTAQYHINGDIAYSIIMYYLVTKDLDFMAEVGVEIIFETARLWLDAGNEADGAFHICSVTGPDEYTCIVDDNYYTNSIAKYNLTWAAKLYHLLKEQGKTEVIDKISLKQAEIRAFQQAADTMYYPYSEELNVTPQDRNFLAKEVWNIKETPKEKFPLLLHYHPLYLYRYQVCKQADTVLSHLLLEDEQKQSTILNSYEYYEKITTHDSSLSSCIFSIMAARLGMQKKAYDYFCETSMLDINNTHHNTKDGIHTASMGGTYLSIIYGFAGLRIKESGLYLEPVLPEQWNEYTFQIQYENCFMQITVNRLGCEISPLEGSLEEVHIYGKEYKLDQKKVFIKGPAQAGR